MGNIPPLLQTGKIKAEARMEALRVAGGKLLYKYDIPVGFSPGITSPREDCCSRA